MHACFNDIEPILDLCQEAHDLSETYRDIPTDRARGKKYLSRMMINPMCLVAYNGHGVLMAIASKAWWHTGWVIADVFFYARKRGRDLIKEYIAWAGRFPGAKEVSLGVTFGGERGERTEKLYRAMGFQKSGSVFRVEL